MKVYIYTSVFWFVAFMITGWLLFFSKSSKVIYDDFFWACGNGYCDVSFYILNNTDESMVANYSLYFVKKISVSSSSFRNFGVGRSHRKEFFLKKEDAFYIYPSERKRVEFRLSVDEIPSDIMIKVKK